MQVLENTTRGRAKAPEDNTGGAGKPEKGRTPHRVGSMVVKGSELENPTTIGQRIAARRLELGVKLEDVAKQITIVPKGGTPRRLSRPAYNMYEIGQVIPTLPVIEQIARALKTSAAWIAFGEGDPNPIEQVVYNPKTDDFDEKDSKTAPQRADFDRKTLWSFDPDFLRDRFDVEPTEVVLAQINDFSELMKPGDIALIRRGEEPSRAAAEFVIGYNGEMISRAVSRPARAGPYRVYSADHKTFEEVDPGDINILGRVVGKIGDCYS